MAELSITDKIGLSAIAVMGRAVAEAAFLLTHPTVKTKNRASLGVMVSRWHHSPQAEAFINEARAGTATVTPSDEASDFYTRSGIIDALVTATRQTSGKDSITGLTTLAKLQGFDKPDGELKEDDKRFFVLPWLSHCRSCALMKLYMQIQKEKELP